MLNWSSSAAGGHHSHLEYKAGARARPKLSHPAPVKRGAGGLPSFSLTFLHSVFSYNFTICHLFHLLQVLGILQLDAPKTAHHVTQGDINCYKNGTISIAAVIIMIKNPV